MDIYIARQPIFDRNLKVVAYELLYRADQVNAASSDGDRATSSVIINSLVMMGMDKITDHKRAFVNFTSNLLIDDLATVFSPKSVVIEVLETVKPDVKVIEAIKKLKSLGYTIALDDYVEDYPYEEIVNLSDIVKVDFMLSTPEQVENIGRRFWGKSSKLLAEKVETLDQFKMAVKLGYTYFQGYFFSKPNIVSSKDVRSLNVSYVRILKELGEKEPDFSHMAKIIETDLALSYKLVKLVNSAAFFSRKRISSVHDAIVRIGIKEIRKWISLIMLRDMGENKPEELVKASLVRARALELATEHTGQRSKKTEYFLIGLFSMIDTIMDRPLAILLNELPLEEEIKKTLLGEETPLKYSYDVIVAYERGDWDCLDVMTCGVMKKVDSYANAYVEALKWTTEVFLAIEEGSNK